MRRLSSTYIGILSIMAAWFTFSLNDVGIKLLSDDYALHQITLIRTLVGILVTLLIIMPLDGGWSNLRSKHPFLNLARGLCVVMSNMTFYLGLATLSLPESMAIFFIAPLMITIMSVIFLGEQVGLRRWMAVMIGLLGVMIMMRLGTNAFKIEALLPLLSGTFYAGLQVLTRKTGANDKASTMSFYIQIIFICVSLLLGLFISDGKYMQPDYPSLDFLLRAWVWPEFGDFLIIAALGIATAGGGFLISQAYRITEAAILAPFEYMALVYAIIWSALIWRIIPNGTDWIGIALIAGSGLYIWWREVRTSEKANPA